MPSPEGTRNQLLDPEWLEYVEEEVLKRQAGGGEEKDDKYRDSF